MTADRVQLAQQLLHRHWMQEDYYKTDKELNDKANGRLYEWLRKSSLKPDGNTFDLLVALAAELIRRGDPLEDWLANFTADVLSGKVKRPRQRTKDLLKTYRDYNLWRTSAEIAKLYHLPLYTNNELSKKTTAAEIVSQAAGCKLELVVQAIKKSQRRFGGIMPEGIFPQDRRG